MDVVVTTAHKPSTELIKNAASLAEILKTTYIPRVEYSLAALMKNFNAAYIVIATKKGPVVHTPGGEYFFHLSMAELRIKNLINGKHDHMITAMGLTPGMTVLDCTVGLASDAIVASYLTGQSGRIDGLESSPLIAAITGLGLSGFTSDNPDITAALRRIKLHEADYNTYLQSLPDNSYDIVYFDPMFRVPVDSSSNLKPIRYLADSRPITGTAIREARRVAKNRVVIKESNGSNEFSRLGINTVLGGKYSSVQYGVLQTVNCHE